MAVTQSNQDTVRSTSFPASTRLDAITSAPQKTTTLPEDVSHSISPPSLVMDSRDSTKLGKLSAVADTAPVPVEEAKGKVDGFLNGATPSITPGLRSRSNSVEVVSVKQLRTPKSHGPAPPKAAPTAIGGAASQSLVRVSFVSPVEPKSISTTSVAASPKLKGAGPPGLSGQPDSLRRSLPSLSSPSPAIKSTPFFSANNFLAAAGTTQPQLTRQLLPNRPWTSAMYADMAQMMQELFPFRLFAAKHSKDPREVLKVFAEVIQAPLLRHSATALDTTKANNGAERNALAVPAVGGKQKEALKNSDDKIGNKGVLEPEQETERPPPKKRAKAQSKRDTVTKKESPAPLLSPTNTNAEAIERAKELKKVVDNFLKAEKSTMKRAPKRKRSPEVGKGA